MAVPERELARLCGVCVVLILGAGCASTGKKAPQPPPSVAPIVNPAGAEIIKSSTPEVQSEQSEQPRTDPPIQIGEEPDDSVVVIDPGGAESISRVRLADLAAAERRRRAKNTETPVLVITDENLSQHAEGGKLTYAEEKPGSIDSLQESLEEGVADEEELEAYWRHRVRTVRQEWSDEVDKVLEFEEEAADLRLQFYAAEDPFHRDTRIKPAWDRALEGLEQSRKRARELEVQVQNVLGEGARSGAFPGWLREGANLEPKTRPYNDEGKAPVTPLIQEPNVVEEYPQGGD